MSRHDMSQLGREIHGSYLCSLRILLMAFHEPHTHSTSNYRWVFDLETSVGYDSQDEMTFRNSRSRSNLR